MNPMSSKELILMHKNLAFSFVYMARANKISGNRSHYIQYMRYAKEHLDHAKRLKNVVSIIHTSIVANEVPSDNASEM